MQYFKDDATAFDATKRKLGKDRFRRNLGGIEEAYQEVLKKVLG